MKKISTLFILSIISLFICFPLTAQEMTKEQKAMMEMYEKISKPGPPHEILKKLTGDWEINWSYVMTKDDKPEKGGGTSKNTMMLGDRYLNMDASFSMMGELKHSINILGFDNRNGKYFAFGIDEFGTFYVIANGDYDKAKNKLVLSGTDKDFMSGKDVPFRMEITFVDKNTFDFDIYNGEGKDEYKSLDMTYKKK
jgi:hypothetical protein